ncbi:interleukin-17 receptor B isoform X3 [Suricata suricatta]|uniref:interleukin-17 receptor B isoform X3 n=1 Tax=Suricata suricatta TaxID=37032 RepID=UPI001155D0CA|nr:interleukin-17 receptor B isoform X3 [Suricata suricatta]
MHFKKKIVFCLIGQMKSYEGIQHDTLFLCLLQTIQCGSEPGPSPEWMVQHTLTPGDLRDLRVESVRSRVVMEDYSILMNVSWVLRADASIRLLKATKICVTGKSNLQSYSCVRCNYTEAFQTQTRPSGGRWTFSYVGFPVELNTVYFVGAHNIPNANMNEDSPSMSVNFTSPGSLWDPNVTACKKNKTAVEVNFTTSSLGNKYMALIRNHIVIGFSTVLEADESPFGKSGLPPAVFVLAPLAHDSQFVSLLPQNNPQTRTSVVIPVTGESEGAVVQLTPYFRTCGNDCIRRKGTVVLCPQPSVSFSLDGRRSVLGGWLPLLFPALLGATAVLMAGIYLLWRHKRIKKASVPTATLLPPIKVLVVYPPEICFHHTVCYFTEFLQNHCRSEVILEDWQKKKIAEMGPVQWLTTQKKAVDKVIFLLSNDVNTMCDGTCDKSEGGRSPHENSQGLFPLAFNLFCSDLRSQTSLCKYMVVYFRETDTKEEYSALSVCPKYCLMKDAPAFCTELLRAEQHVSAGKRLTARSLQATQETCGALKPSCSSTLQGESISGF